MYFCQKNEEIFLIDFLVKNHIIMQENKQKKLNIMGHIIAHVMAAIYCAFSAILFLLIVVGMFLNNPEDDL